MAETFELNNPVNRSSSFRVSHFENDKHFNQLSSFNEFVVVIMLKGKGSLSADNFNTVFSNGSLMSFSLYQPFKISCPQGCQGYLIAFHPDFFCLHQHRTEVSCNGVLFNNIYESPLIGLTERDVSELLTPVNGMLSEMRRAEQDTEVLVSYLKVLLINASRIRLSQRKALDNTNKIPDKLLMLQAGIEANFRMLHHAGAYAALFNSSPAVLNKSCKAIFHKTLSELITDRIILEAKRELYLTTKPVKLIGYELGFRDEFYFSRYFKRNIGVSPQHFRDTVGVGKAVAA